MTNRPAPAPAKPAPPYGTASTHDPQSNWSLRRAYGSCSHRLHSGNLDDTWYRDDCVTPDHERPAFAVGAGDLGVDEHVLDLLRPPGETVAGPPAANDKPRELGPDAPTAE